MFGNVFQTQIFAGGTFWREIRSPIQVPEPAGDLNLWPSSVCKLIMNEIFMFYLLLLNT